MKIVVAHGTFDIIHYGHIKYLEKAKEFGDYLIVLITSDKLAVQKKGKKPFFNQDIRKKVISSLKCVDEVVLRSETISPELIKKLNADVFVTVYPKYKMLEDACIVKLIERTKEISSTDIKKYIEENL